ncbi:MAG: response regulator [Rhodanobacter sp.]
MTDEGVAPLVLIVEDELMIASTLELTLGMRGYRVLGPAATVEEATQLLQNARPDVALIDYRLARTTTEVLLPLLEEQDIPVCVLTGYNAAQLPPAYENCAVLEKPFPMQQLVSVIEDLSKR